ncbi:MAG TPA: hypothetical protein VKJ01_13870 [Candidatus Solibacter sp.]|nr:hypothetical protein [Candidatus Solibacter sp.]
MAVYSVWATPLSGCGRRVSGSGRRAEVGARASVNKRLNLTPDGEFQGAHDAPVASDAAVPAPQVNHDGKIGDCQQPEYTSIDHVHIHIRTDVYQS